MSASFLQKECVCVYYTTHGWQSEAVPDESRGLALTFRIGEHIFFGYAHRDSTHISNASEHSTNDEWL